MRQTEILGIDKSKLPDTFTTGWEAPSNIALVKYWGKKGLQLPANASISFTLSSCVSKTKINFRKSENPKFSVTLDGKKSESFLPKIITFLDRIKDDCPYLKHYSLEIDTVNTFPHSSGIASSASGFAALSMCIMSLEKEIHKLTNEQFIQKASYIARLGSGSACRSVYGTMASWGKHESITHSSDEYATEIRDIAPVFKNYQDTILLIDQGQKTVSSTVGHGLMYNNPFGQARYNQASKNLTKLIQVLKEGNLKDFNEIVESEALTLHGMMMASTPYFILTKPNTLAAIEKIWDFRKRTGLHPSVTLDAGANVHLLYPKSELEEILPFIEAELKPLCEKGLYICDEVGLGPKPFSL